MYCIDGICADCHDKCDACTGPSEDDCVCHYSCQTCKGSSASDCTSCDNTAHRTILDGEVGNCECDEANGYFDDGSNGSCTLECHPTCLSDECLGAKDTDCTACDTEGHKILENGKCLCDVSKGYV